LPRLFLTLGLRRGGWLGRLGPEVIEAKDNKNRQEHESHHAAHVAATTAAFATRRLKIGIAYFCQWILPIR
jgi:hypothetical protein